MSSFFSQTKDRIENSGWVIPVFGLFCFAFYIGVNLFIEDYQANLAVFEMIPTSKANPNTTLWMARFIQLAPVIFALAYLREMNKIAYGTLSVMFLLVDWGLGVLYRVGDITDPMWIIYAMVEDLLFFTLGSEMLITLSGGIVFSLAVPVVKQLWNKIMTGFVGSPSPAKPPSSSQSFKPPSDGGGRPEQPYKPGASPPTTFPFPFEGSRPPTKKK